MKKLSLILSFDYELPLGGCASYEHGLFEPSRQLLELADRLEAPVVLFADVCSAMRFDAWDRDGYYRPFVEQIQTYIDHGHDVQLHIHPHWLTSDYRDGRILPSVHFGLGHFGNPTMPYSVDEIVRTSSRFLADVCRETDSSYECIAYRAGGYNFAPRAAAILKSLYTAGIRVESSVTKGFYLKAASNFVDQRSCPKEPNWFIDLDADPTTPGSSGLFEVPIAAMPISLPEALGLRLSWRTHRKQIAAKTYDHTGYSFPNVNPDRSLRDRWSMLMNPLRLTFDQGFYDVDRLLAILKYNVHTYADYDYVVLSAISHPKSMGRYQLDLMEEFITRARREHGSLLDLCTYRDVYDDRKLGNAI